MSVVVPVLNDARGLARLLADLGEAPGLEVVVVDGGSTDGSVEVAAAADVLLAGPQGRGPQLRLGADHAAGEWLWLLHADSRVSLELVHSLYANLDRPGWGFFRVRLDGGGWALRMVETAMNWRSAASGIATGDQGLFLHRRLLDAVGGIPPIRLMEDIECSRRLRAICRPRRLRGRLVTSARRWQRDGVAATIVLMWWLRLRYWAGADPDDLASRYYGSPVGDPDPGKELP